MPSTAHCRITPATRHLKTTLPQGFLQVSCLCASITKRQTWRCSGPQMSGLEHNHPTNLCRVTRSKHCTFSSRRTWAPPGHRPCQNRPSTPCPTAQSPRPSQPGHAGEAHPDCLPGRPPQTTHFPHSGLRRAWVYNPGPMSLMPHLLFCGDAPFAF